MLTQSVKFFIEDGEPKSTIVSIREDGSEEVETVLLVQDADFTLDGLAAATRERAVKGAVCEAIPVVATQE